jgi:hypothetical protein
MLAPYIDPLGELRKIRPDLNSFVLKFDLEELTVIYHPEDMKIICIFKDSRFQDYHSIFNFYIELTKKINLINLSLSICFSNEDSNFNVNDMFFQDIEYSLYRIRAN